MCEFFFSGKVIIVAAFMTGDIKVRKMFLYVKENCEYYELVMLINKNYNLNFFINQYCFIQLSSRFSPFVDGMNGKIIVDYSTDRRRG